jgi:hypothetical protein
MWAELTASSSRRAIVVMTGADQTISGRVSPCGRTEPTCRQLLDHALTGGPRSQQPCVTALEDCRGPSGLDPRAVRPLRRCGDWMIESASSLRSRTVASSCSLSAMSRTRGRMSIVAAALAKSTTASEEEWCERRQLHRR